MSSYRDEYTQRVKTVEKAFYIFIGLLMLLWVVWLAWPTRKVTVNEGELGGRSYLNYAPPLGVRLIPWDYLSLQNGRRWRMSLAAGYKLHQQIDPPFCPTQRIPDWSEEVTVTLEILYGLNWVVDVQVTPELKFTCVVWRTS